MSIDNRKPVQPATQVLFPQFPERIPLLRSILLPSKKALCPDRIKEELFDRVMESEGTSVAIRDGVVATMSEICACNQLTNAALVADCLSAWDMAFPGAGLAVIDALEKEANSYLNGAGEGIAIGLLEIANHAWSRGAYEMRMFEVFVPGTIVAVMAGSKMTQSGQGRLSEAIREFVNLSWADDNLMKLRRTEIALAIDALGAVIPDSIDMRTYIGVGCENFLAHFVSELDLKFTLTMPLGFRLKVNSLRLEHMTSEIFAPGQNDRH